MGIQSLQDFVDSFQNQEQITTKFLAEERKNNAEKKINEGSYYVVHLESCLNLFYQEFFTDWVCGGQWNEIFQNVDKFVRGFKQCGSDLTIFFDGTLNEISINEWRQKNTSYSENAKEILEQVASKQQVPFKSKPQKFVPPGTLKTALRLAFRACNVIVCSSIDDVYTESILYAKDAKGVKGVIAKDANFFLYDCQTYLSSSISKYGKKTTESLRRYCLDKILTELDVDIAKLPHYAALLGNSFITDKDLSAFYWDLIDEDSPLMKIKVC